MHLPAGLLSAKLQNFTPIKKLKNSISEILLEISIIFVNAEFLS